MTTGLPARRAMRVICFCSPGTFSTGISTPRSPRATINASTRSKISPRRLIACGFSILAMTAARPRVIFLASAISSGRWTKESATQSTPASRPASKSERSFSVNAENGTVVSGTLTPLRSDSFPPTSTRVRMRWLSASMTTSRSLPSSRRSVWPGSMAAKISGCGRCTRWASPGAGSASSAKVSPLVSVAGLAAKLPTLSFGPCRSSRIPIGRLCSVSTSRIAAVSSRMRAWVVWLMLMRKTSAPASNRLAITRRSEEAGPRVATILVRRRRRISCGFGTEASGRPAGQPSEASAASARAIAGAASAFGRPIR